MWGVCYHQHYNHTILHLFYSTNIYIVSVVYQVMFCVCGVFIIIDCINPLTALWIECSYPCFTKEETNWPNAPQVTHLVSGRAVTVTHTRVVYLLSSRCQHCLCDVPRNGYNVGSL